MISGEPAAATRKALEALGGIARFVKKGQRVVIKPNMSFAKTPDFAATTHPLVVVAVAQACIEAGAGEVLVLDHTLQRAELCLERTGIRDACRKHVPGVHVLALQDRKFFREIRIPQGKVLDRVEVLTDILDNAVLINVPVAKSHSATGVSLGLKGLMGLIWDRESFHSQFNINQGIADLATVIKPQLTILDATRAMVSGGPGGPGRRQEAEPHRCRRRPGGGRFLRCGHCSLVRPELQGPPGGASADRPPAGPGEDRCGEAQNHQGNRMRKTIQALSLLLFTAFFLLATYRLPDWLPADIYLRIDPLLGINAVIASREIIARVLWSLVLVGATLAVGRFFCAYVCPLGASIDGLDFLLFRKGKRRGLKTDSRLRRWKYFLLIVIIAAAVTGVSLVYLLDPIALLTRFYTFVLYPLAIAVLNLLLDLLRPLSQGLGWVEPRPSSLSPARLLHDGPDADDLRGGDRPEPPGAAVLVPLSLSPGRPAQPDLAARCFQAPGQRGVQSLHGLPKGLPHGGDR